MLPDISSLFAESVSYSMFSDLSPDNCLNKQGNVGESMWENLWENLWANP